MSKIQQLINGEIALVNDVTAEEMRVILTHAFPDDNYIKDYDFEENRQYNLYYLANSKKTHWYTSTELPIGTTGVKASELLPELAAKNKSIIKGKYLISTDNYFVAPDGNEYRAVWGECEVAQDSDVWGIKTNARSTNWYIKVGSEDKHVIVAGCQIHYAAKCENKPNTGRAKSWAYDAANGSEEFDLPTKIYIAE